MFEYRKQINTILVIFDLNRSRLDFVFIFSINQLKCALLNHFRWISSFDSFFEIIFGESPLDFICVCVCYSYSVHHHHSHHQWQHHFYHLSIIHNHYNANIKYCTTFVSNKKNWNITSASGLGTPSDFVLW